MTTKFVNKNSYHDPRKKDRGLIINFAVGISFFLIGGFLGGSLIYQQYKQFDDPNVRKLVEIYEIMLNEWYFGDDSDVSADLLAKNAIEGMLGIADSDPYTFYTATMEEQNLSLNAKGIGISSIYYGGYRYINDVYENSSAFGVLNIGDIMQEILVNDQWVNLKTLSAEEGSNLLRGDESSVTMKVLTAEGLKTFELLKTNYTVQAVSLVEDYFDSEDNLCVTVKIRSFLSQRIRSDLTSKLQEIEKKYEKQVFKLTIDLRNNGGGYVNSAVDLCSMFVPENSIIVRQRYRDGTDYYYRTSAEPNYGHLQNISIVQNGRTASASESFAVAMKDLLPNKTHIVGSTSFGKGIIQSIKTFSDGSVLRYTIGEAYSPNNYSIHGKGLSPDDNYAIEYDYEFIFTNFVDIDELSDYAKEQIFRQIELLLGQSFVSYYIAVSQFQNDYGLPVTGEADRETKLTLQKALVDYYLDINAQTDVLVMGT